MTNEQTLNSMDNTSTTKSNTVNAQPYPWLLFSTLLLALPQPLFLCCWFCLGNSIDIMARAFGGFVVAMGILSFALGIKILAVYALTKEFFHNKWSNYVCCALFVVFDWLMLLFLSVRKKKPFALLFLMLLFALLCFITLGHFQKFQWILQYHSTIGIVSMLCSCAAIIVLNGGFSRKCSFALIPLVLCILLHSALYFHKAYIQRECGRIKARISTMVGGYPTEVADYRRRVESGSSVDDEPLKSLISFNETIDSDAFPKLAATMSNVREKYDEFMEKHSDFVAAVRETVKNTPQRVAHKWKDDIYSILLPELSAFRKASRFLAMEMKANATDRNLIAANNNAMIKMRDCALENTFLISRLVGIAIEALRLDALAFTLPYNIYNIGEFEALLGEPPNWNLRIAQSLLDEMLAHENIKDYILKNPYEIDKIGGGEDESATKAMHFSGIVYATISNLFEYDVLLGWRFNEKDIGFALAEKRSYTEMEKQEHENVEQMKRSGAILCEMLWPSMKSVLKKMDQTIDTRRMAILAWRVMDYSHSHGGTLPESLEVFDDVPVDSLNGLPFEYRHGDLEFNSVSGEGKIRFSGFRIAPADKDAEDQNLWRNNAICVPIP